MAKATHKGTCQCCGAVQKLPNGVLSKHGYTVDWGYFNGTCSGAGSLPFEKSKDLVDSFIDSAKRQIERIKEEIEETAKSTDPTAVWFYKYTPATYSTKSSYRWEKRGLVLNPNWQPDDPRWKAWAWEEKDEDKRSVNRGSTGIGDMADNIEDAVRFENAKYIKALERRIKGISDYIKWQEERIENWEEKDLIEL